jgi:predicted component of type VI protein secretion system
MELTIIASIASILGFSLQVLDKLKNDDDKLIYFLIKLSEKSSYLKAVHTQYHAIYRGVTSLDNFLRDPNRPNLYRKSGNINSDDLLEVINNETLKEFSESIDNVLSEEMNQIKIEIDFSSNKDFLALLSDNNQIASKIRMIIQSQNRVVELHQNYCDFFDKLKPIQDKNELIEEDKKFILNNRRLTSTNYNNIITDTDRALMQYLDIYSFVLNMIKIIKKY